jgi:hypothetical protein
MASIKEKPQYFESRIQSPFERKNLNQNYESNRIKD